MPKSLLIDATLGQELKDLLQYYKDNPPPPNQPPRPHRDDSGRPVMVGILLQDLPSGGTADCALLAFFQTSLIQKVSQFGSVTGGTFTLGFAQQNQTLQTTSALQWNASAASVQAALNALSSIGTNGVTVSLGNQKYTNSNSQAQTTENPGLWLASFTGKQFAALTSVPLLTVTPSLSGTTGSTASVSALTYWGDTGRVETVNAAIPVGDPTPLRAGATVICHFHALAGWIVGSCEPRQFGTPY